MKPRRLRIVCLALTLLALSACASPAALGGAELGRRLLIEAVGIDLSEDGVLLTVLAPDLTTQENDSQTPSVSLLRFTGASLSEAVEAAKRETGLLPFFGYARFLILGKTAAQSGLPRALSFFIENRSIRNDSPVCVAEKDAADTLGAPFVAAQTAARTAEGVLTEHGNAVMPFYRFITLLLTPGANAWCPVLSLKRQGSGVLPSAEKTAVFGDKGRVFTVEEEASAFLRLLDGGMQEASFTFAGSGEALRLRQIKRKITAEKDGMRFTVTAGLRLPEASGTLAPRARRARTESAAAFLSAKAAAVLDMLYRKYGTDPLRLCRRISPQADVRPEELSFTVRFVLKD